MALTYEQLETELAETPDLLPSLLDKKQADIVKHFTDKGHVFKAKVDYDKDVNTQVTTQVTSKVQKAIDDEAALLYGSADKLATMITGRTKPDGMRTKVWIDQLKSEGLWPETEEQLKEIIKKHGGTNSVDNGLKKEIEKMKQDQIERDRKGFEKRMSDLVRSDLKTASVPVDAALKGEEAINNAKKDARSDLNDFFNMKYVAAEDESGDVFFYKKGDPDKAAILNTNGYLSPLDIIKLNHKNLLAIEGHQQSGGGSGGGNGGGDPAKATEGDIIKAAAKKGLVFNSPDWKKFVADEKKAANLK